MPLRGQARRIRRAAARASASVQSRKFARTLRELDAAGGTVVSALRVPLRARGPWGTAPSGPAGAGLPTARRPGARWLRASASGCQAELLPAALHRPARDLARHLVQVERQAVQGRIQVQGPWPRDRARVAPAGGSRAPSTRSRGTRNAPAPCGSPRRCAHAPARRAGWAARRSRAPSRAARRGTPSAAGDGERTSAWQERTSLPPALRHTQHSNSYTSCSKKNVCPNRRGQTSERSHRGGRSGPVARVGRP